VLDADKTYPWQGGASSADWRSRLYVQAGITISSGMRRSRVGSLADGPGVIECCWRRGAWSMSAPARIPDSSRTSREVRKVPTETELLIEIMCPSGPRGNVGRGT